MKKAFLLWSAVAVTIALSGCGTASTPKPAPTKEIPPAAASSQVAPAEKEASLTFYKASEDGLHILPVKVKVKAKDYTAKTAITEMLRADRNSKYPLLPAGVSLKSIHIEDGIATVNFTKEINSLKGETSESLFIAMTVDTLTEFPTIQRVEFRAEGKPLQFQTKMGQFKRDESYIAK